MAWTLWECLSPKKQKELIKAGWKAVEEKLVVINLDCDIEDIEEIGHLIRQKPQNVKRGEKW